jgi:hypothetical protein|tara:strand:+ start:60 stop:221 length:162 start_codon:yes stop_codon:yes gene_type:complete
MNKAQEKKTIRKMNCETPGDAERRIDNYFKKNSGKIIEVWIKGKLSHRVEDVS